MNTINKYLGTTKIVGLTLLLAAVAGCVGYVDTGFVAPEPGVVVFGGPYERGHDVRVYSHRGYVSRGWHR